MASSERQNIIVRSLLKKISLKSDSFIQLYYLTMAVAMIALTGYGDSLLPNELRIIFLFFTIIPVFSHCEYLSWVIAMFLGVSLVSFSPIFPTDQDYYFPVLALMTIWVIYKKHILHIRDYGFKRNIIVTWLLLLCFFGLMHLEFPHFIVPIILMILLFYSIKDKQDVMMLLEGIIYTSLILSVMYLLYKDRFLEEYGASTSNVERASWINPNVYGIYVSSGSVIAAAALLKHIPVQRTILKDIFFYATTILGGVVICLLACRGALLAWAICTMLLMLTSKIKLYYKIGFCGILACAAYWMFKSGYMDLLLFRIEEGSLETGSNRTLILQMKLSAFFSAPYTPVDWLIGIGKENCDNLAFSTSTHDDSLTAFIAYGFLGLICYIIFLFYPIFKSKYHKKTVFILSIYLVMISFLQEPVFRGELSYLLFYLAVILIAQIPATNER